MIGSGEATAGLVDATKAAMRARNDGSAAAAEQALAPPPAPPPALVLPELPSGKARPELEAGIAQLTNEAPKTVPPSTAGLRAIRPSDNREGGYQLDQPLRITGGGVPLESRIVRPGVKGEASFKRVMNDLSPEGQRDQHFEGAQNVYLQRENALEAERLANESHALDNEDRKAEIASRRAKLQEKQGYIEQREREAADATPQSRNEILANRGTMSKMMGALSIIMGARYQGMTGRNNPGLDLINQTIAQEIADQRAKYEAAKDKVGMANNDYAKAMQLYGDPNVAEADLYNRNLTLAANIAQNHWKRAENEGEYAKQKEVAQALMEQAAAKKQEAFTLLNGQVLQEVYKREEQKVSGLLDEKQLARQVYIPGYGYGFVTNVAQQKDIQDRATYAGNAIDLIAEMRSHMPKNGGPVTDLGDRKAIKALKVRVLAALSKAEGQGIVTEADAKNAKDVLADENALFTRGDEALGATEIALGLSLEGVVNSVYSDPNGRTPMRKRRAPSFKPGL
jgi:hypothetical protein